MDIFSSSAGVKNVNSGLTVWGAERLASVLGGGGAIIGGLSLLIVGRSAERGEKPAACGPDRLFSYARTS